MVTPPTLSKRSPSHKKEIPGTDTNTWRSIACNEVISLVRNIEGRVLGR
jgi:hypothetical protein